MGSVLPPGEPDDGPDAPVTAAVEPPQADEPAGAPASPPGGRWRRRRRRILIWGSASLAVLLVAVLGTGYTLLRHFNANIQQDDIKGLLGKQPVNLHPQAENILVLGSDTRHGQGSGYGTGLVTDQSDTLMIVHIPADRKWAEVMSIPRDSWVNIPACTMGDGQLSAPTQFKVNEAFAIGNLDGNHTALGVACTVKTVEQDTGIYINHFVVVNFSGFKDMVAPLAASRNATRRRSTIRCPTCTCPPGTTCSPRLRRSATCGPGTRWATAATWSGSAASRRSCRRWSAG